MKMKMKRFNGPIKKNEGSNFFSLNKELSFHLVFSFDICIFNYSPTTSYIFYIYKIKNQSNIKTFC